MYGSLDAASTILKVGRPTLLVPAGAETLKADARIRRAVQERSRCFSRSEQPYAPRSRRRDLRTASERRSTIAGQAQAYFGLARRLIAPPNPAIVAISAPMTLPTLTAQLLASRKRTNWAP
jgi:hypothetical protein